MNPNIAIAPAPKLMQDVTPPYADALPRRSPAEDNQPLAVDEQAEIPVHQPQALQESPAPSPMFPVASAEQAIPAQPVEQAAPAPEATQHEAHQPTPATRQPQNQVKTNWAVIGLAVLVASALLVVAFLAFRQSS